MRKSYKLHEAMESQRSRGTIGSIASGTQGRYGAIEQNIDDDQDRSLEHGPGQGSMDQNRSGPFRHREPARKWRSLDLWIWLDYHEKIIFRIWLKTL